MEFVIFYVGAEESFQMDIHRHRPEKALHARAATLCSWEVVGGHNAVVAGASAPPAAVPGLGRQAAQPVLCFQ